MLKPRDKKILILTLGILLLGSAWNVGFRLFLPRGARDTALQLGIRAYSAGQVDQALSYFLDAEKKAPADATIQYMLGQAYEAIGREDEAIARYKKALGLNPDQPEAHYNLAVIYNRRKDHLAGTVELKKALKLNSRFHGARLMLGGLYIELEEYSTAVAELNKLLAVDTIGRSREISTRLLLARAFLAQEDIDQARRQWEEVIRLDLTNQEAQQQLSKYRP